jgi:L-ascorbate metabolism protein UlaG (beta-lactamase superfamily)
MKIKYFSYNTFLIEDATVKIAIDPGLNLWIGKLNSLLPKSEWSGITHLLATHGDPDHYWYIDRVAQSSNAPVVCGKELVNTEGEEKLFLDPRKRGVHYSTKVGRLYTLDVGEIIEVDGVTIQGLKSVHGPVVLYFLFGLIRHETTPGPGERVGLGAIGFKITVGDTTLVNLGDSLFQKEWEGLKPDILMIPIGGRIAKNTMNEEEALEAVQLISPKLVIPCHHNEAFFWKRNCNPADGRFFKEKVEDLGIECRVMGYGDEISFTTTA